MEKFDYGIVGGGMAADAAVKGIRELDENDSILMISKEKDPPYIRPPLSKSLWKGKQLESIWRGTEEKYVDILLGQEVVTIKPAEKKVTVDNGQEYSYKKLLLATGGRTRKLPFGGEDIIYYRTLEDYRRLKALAETIDTFAVIGSGFIGSEISAALAQNGKEVVLFDIGAGIGWNIFPENIVKYLNNYYKDQHVRVVPNVKVKLIRKFNGSFIVVVESGDAYKVDAVVAGVGIEPQLELAQSIGLKVDNGIHVDEYLRTGNPSIYASGDVANFYTPILKERVRVEHEDNANTMGRLAGRNMAGAEEKYDYLPMFYSDLFDIGYEAVGKLDPRGEVVQDWQEEYQKGILYYLDNDRVKGVLLWNVWGKVDQARDVIAMSALIRKKDLIGRIK